MAEIFKRPAELSGATKEVLGGILGGATFGIPLTLVNVLASGAGPIGSGIAGGGEALLAYGTLGQVKEQREEFMHGFWFGGAAMTLISTAFASLDAIMAATGRAVVTEDVAMTSRLFRRFGVDLNTLKARVSSATARARAQVPTPSVAPGVSVGPYRRFSP